MHHLLLRVLSADDLYCPFHYRLFNATLDYYTPFIQVLQVDILTTFIVRIMPLVFQVPTLFCSLLITMLSITLLQTLRLYPLGSSQLPWTMGYHVSYIASTVPLLLFNFITKYLNLKSRAYIALALQICTTTVSCGQPTLHVHPCPPPTAKFLWNCYSVPTVSLSRILAFE